MAEQGNRVTRVIMTILLTVVFIVLIIYIGATLSNTFRSSKRYAQQKTQETLKCNDYSFLLSDIIYENNTLSFTIENVAGEKFDELIINYNNKEKTINLNNFYAGTEQKVIISNINITNKFSVYPKGCKNYNKTYSINITG